MTPTKPNTEYQRAFRARQSELGLAEVRGIYARPDQHAEIKARAKAIVKAKRTKKAKA